MIDKKCKRDIAKTYVIKKEANGWVLQHKDNFPFYCKQISEARAIKKALMVAHIERIEAAQNLLTKYGFEVTYKAA